MEYPSNISNEELELIEQYLDQELPAASAAAFEERLLRDTTLAAKLEEVKWLRTGIEEAVLQEQLNKFHEEIPRVNEREKPKGRIISLGMKVAVAACVLLLLSLSIWIFQTDSSHSRLYQAYFTADPGLITAMGSSDDYSFEKAMVDYKNGDYAKAIQGWESLLTSRPNSDTLQYFIGVAHLADGKQEKAIPLLQKCVADSNSPFYKDANWYLGLALLKNGATETSIPYLNKSGHPKSQQLITELNQK